MTAPDKTNERAARLQEHLNAVAIDTAHRRDQQPAAGSGEWARLQQRLSTETRRRQRIRIGLVSAVAACAVLAAGLSWTHLNGGGSSVRVVPAAAPSDTGSTDPDPGVTGQPFDASRQGEIIVASDEERVHMVAALQGPLTRVGSCVGVRDTLVIWSAGTTWDAATSTLTLADGSTSQLGAEMQIGGGIWRAAQVADLSQQAAQALTDCGASLDQDIWIT